MEIKVRKIGGQEQEYIEIGCHAEDTRVKSIVRFVKGLDGSVPGSKGEHIYEIPVVDIFYIESVDDKIFAYTCDDVIRLEGTLAGIIQKLGDERFFRCSKSMIINIDKVDSLHSLSSNRIDATMEGGEHIMISRTYASEFRRILRGYERER